MKEYISERATVRFYPGELTEEQLRAVIEDAARDFYRGIQKAKQRKQREESARAVDSACIDGRGSCSCRDDRSHGGSEQR